MKISSTHACTILNCWVWYSWLKQVWVCESIEGELRESDATQMAKKLNPLATDAYARRIVAVNLIKSIVLQP